MLSEHCVAALRRVTHDAMQEHMQTVPFDKLSAAIRATIDSAIADAGEARNAKQWDNRMPPELLAATFAYMGFAGCVIASHVCRFWRAVALSSPALWANITISLPKRGADGESADLLLRNMVERSCSVPIHFTLKADQPRRINAPRVVWSGPGCRIRLAPLVRRSGQLYTLHLDLQQERLIEGWDELLCDLPQLRRMSLRFGSGADMNRAVSRFPGTLPLLISLEISRAFEIPEQLWPRLPALKHLTMRKDNSRPFDVSRLRRFVLPVGKALESITLVSAYGFTVSPRSPGSYPPCSASRLVLRGSPTDDLTYNDLISTLSCERVPHIALQSSRPSLGVPSLRHWTSSGFEPTELCLYRPPHMRTGYDDRAVARLQDVNGRSRTYILVQRPRLFLVHPCITSITRLTLDECDFTPDEFPQTALLPALTDLTIRLGGTIPDARRPGLFVPEGGPMRITSWAMRYQGVWRLTALHHLELACVPRSRLATITGGDLVYFLDRLCAPAPVQLQLQNLGVHDSPGSPEHELLRRRVSQLTLYPEYRPHAVERDWELWDMSDDKAI
ncbi:hypothetical protein AURDEDRAFT_171300 [Auricularia subglabra TFB-10046 SS5]|nr:hypothetical protein AURDEDRAFT_171300 [Auricularia subglabra TFB-10046 SS5]